MQCVDENPEEIYKLISSSEMDLESQKRSQRQLQSASLLNKELASVDVKPPEYLMKVNFLNSTHVILFLYNFFHLVFNWCNDIIIYNFV